MRRWSIIRDATSTLQRHCLSYTQGVIKDFLRLEMSETRYRAEKAIESLCAQIQKGQENLQDAAIYPKILQDDIILKLSLKFLDELKKLFSHFESAEPDAAPNNNRNKIAYGHVVEKEIEVNSLKKFLHLHQIYLVVSTLTTTTIRVNGTHGDAYEQKRGTCG